MTVLGAAAEETAGVAGVTDVSGAAGVADTAGMAGADSVNRAEEHRVLRVAFPLVEGYSLSLIHIFVCGGGTRQPGGAESETASAVLCGKGYGDCLHCPKRCDGRGEEGAETEGGVGIRPGGGETGQRREVGFPLPHEP